MRISAKKFLGAAAIAAFFCASLRAEKTPVDGLSRATLPNGLDVFAIENHAAPLAHIEIAVHAGGVAQTKENAGLFHLYEHLMFKGNSKYKDSAAVQKAINDMGSPNWNGSTGIECVNYYFTVPSRLLREGMEFWSCALREPLIDADELEREKKVALSEIEAKVADPSYMGMKCVYSSMFPKFPWRADPSGSPEIVRSATVEDLRAIQREYYTPNNAALFVAGDVSPDEVFTLAQEIFGGWERGADPGIDGREAQAQEPFSVPRLKVSLDPSVSESLAYVSVYFRGPDAARDEAMTYAADVAGTLFNDPRGIFARAVLGKEGLGVPSEKFIGEGYATSRHAGIVSFSAALSSPKNALAPRAKLFLSAIQDDVARTIVGDGKSISRAELSRAKRFFKDSWIFQSESAEDFKSTLRFWWSVASEKYFYGYIGNIEKVGKKDIDAFLSKYIIEKNPLVVVSVNPSVYESQKEEFSREGFTPISKEDAFWYLKAR